MIIEFTLRDRNGVELQIGDKVNWVCPNKTVEECTMFGMVNKMWNSGEVIPGRLVLRKEIDHSVELMFKSDDDEINWIIYVYPEDKHKSLEKV